MLNNDLNNLLTSTETATLLLDADLHIRRHTPTCAGLMRIIPSDTGRSIEDLVKGFDDPGLADDCRAVMQGRSVSDREISDKSGNWYLRRVRPYRFNGNTIGGVTVTFPEISDLKRAEAALRDRNAVLEWQANLLRRAAPVIAKDLQGKIVFWNHGAEVFYGWAAADVVGRSIHEVLQTRFPVPLAEIDAAVVEKGRWRGELAQTCADGREVRVDSQWTL